MKLEKDETYFDQIDTEEKAYFLGFLYADGYNGGNRICMELQERDRAILEKFSKIIYGKIHLKYRPKSPPKNGHFGRPNGSFIFAIYSTRLCQKLSKIGMLSKKSLIHDFPNVIPAHLIRHFVRGYFDGDGCLAHRVSNHAKRWFLMIASSKMFCDALKIIAEEYANVDMRPVKTKTKISGIGTSGNRQIKRFMDWIYKDASIFLDRKFVKYQELCADIIKIDSKHNYSKYNNITFDKRTQKWIANVRIDKRTKNIGRYITEDKAYIAQQKYLTLIQQNDANQDERCVESSSKPELVSGLSAAEAI